MPTPQPLTIVVAINPSASFGKSRTVGPTVVARLRAAGHTVTALEEPTFARLVEVATRAIAQKPDALVVVGGDGMVSLGVNLLATTTLPLGIIPSGTGNDMARGLGIPIGDTGAAIDVLLAAIARPSRAIDAGRIRHTDDATGEPRTTWFASVLSAGFDAIVNERANTLRRPRGKSRYLVALAIELARLRPIRYRLVLDGAETVTDAALIAVGNNRSIGGGMRVTPDAVIDDGLFDVLVVTPLSRMAFVRVFPRVFAGTHLTDRRVTVHRAKTVRIEADSVAAYADGERVSLLPVDVEIVPGALHVLMP
ncbi:diacylglycerol/lipid kinase family protein [Conyzicola sp.]|uniref:diacylglycerol/lipid kinase family protein n=1 Tax=Conyzicola sp. TaxID=1969404 RepID=UPI0039891320